MPTALAEAGIAVEVEAEVQAEVVRFGARLDDAACLTPAGSAQALRVEVALAPAARCAAQQHLGARGTHSLLQW